jgi:L-asparaginase
MSRKRVLLAHTGGTIGMRRGPGGYEPAPGHLERLLAAMPELSSPELPETELVEFEPLLDSSDMAPSDWQRVARIIESRYDRFDGFVVLHGTDTLAYTASALSFLLEGLGKPVVVTGSQVPLGEVRTDARENLVGSLLVAAGGQLPEVTVCFGGLVMRGNRVTKVSSTGFAAFESPNFPPLVRLGVAIEPGPAAPRPPAEGPLRVADLRPVSVAALRLFPGITPELVANVLRPPLSGLVLETYGAGNAPTRDPALLEALASAVGRGVVVVNTTQCLRGGVDMDGYATGSALRRAGVVSGADMTPEAALAKLIWLLGQGLEPARVRELAAQDLRGELTA